MRKDGEVWPGWTDDGENIIHFLRLYVAGTAPVSVRAINNLKAILEQYLPGRYNLEIIDVHQQPELAERDNIAAVPVLLKLEPTPYRLLIGDMSDEVRVLKGLGISKHG